MIRREHYTVVIISFILVSLSYIVQGNIGVNLADEGYLWYGSIRTWMGEIPTYDFQSYDPGRYYWIAFWYNFLGDGLLSTRIALAIFQFIGLSFALLIIRKVIKSWWVLSIVAIILLLWMYPGTKVIDISFSIISVYVALMLLKRPTLMKHLIAGIFVGIAAFFGRNHGVYSLLSYGLLIMFIWYKLDRGKLLERVGAWFVGIIVGYSPMIIMWLFVPGFFNNFINNIIAMFHRGNTNLPLPTPWPWAVDYSALNPSQTVYSFLVGVLFVLLPLMYTIVGIYLLYLSRENLKDKHILVATVFVGIMYMQHAFSRADFSHLAQSILPFLILCILIPYLIKHKYEVEIRRGVLLLISVITISTVWTVQPIYVKSTGNADDFILTNIAGDNIWTENGNSRIIDSVKKINENIDVEEKLLVIPHWPMVYPILDKESPTWDNYFVFTETVKGQEIIINSIIDQNVNWIILGDVALDGRDELRFINTHPKVWKYINENYVTTDSEGLPSNFEVYHKKNR